MKDWHQSLPPEVLDMLRMSHDELNDFSAATTRMEALSKMAFRRAVESVATEQQEDGAAAWGDEDSLEAAQWREKKTSGRIALAISAHKELVKAKTTRLEALDKYEKAEDAPKPAMIQFSAKMPSPREAVERLIHMGRLTEARKNAKVLGIEHEFDWEDVPV